MVKRVSLLQHEMDTNRKRIDVLAHLLAQTFRIMESGSILLCGDDTTRLGELRESLVDQLDVPLLELMVVGEGEGSEVLGVGRQVMDNLLW